jgi:hypothetical protein
VVSFSWYLSRNWFKLGSDIFFGGLQHVSLESPNIQVMLDFQASVRKIGCDHGLVMFLSKQIPCSCLEEDKNNAKQAPKKRGCNYCYSEDLKMELKKCSQCEAVKYCSKECQVADWRAGHKKECNGFKGLGQQNAVFRAQTRR